MIQTTILRETPYAYQFHAVGQLYKAWYEQDVLTAGTSIYFELRNTGTNIPHILSVNFKSTSTDTRMQVFQGGDFTPGTTPMNYSNKNHIIDKTPSLVPYQDPTGVDLTGANIRLHRRIFGQGATGNRPSASSDQPDAFIEHMFDNTDDYIIQIDNLDTSNDATIVFNLEWYESGN